MSKGRRVGALVVALLAGVLLTGCSSQPELTKLDQAELESSDVQEQPSVTKSLQVPSEEAEQETRPAQEATDEPSADPATEPAAPAASAPSAEPTQDEDQGQSTPEPRTITFSEVEAKNERDNCWIILFDEVYDFTLFVQQHPFGAQLSNAVCGQDATQTFQENTDINEVLERLAPFYMGPIN